MYPICILFYNKSYTLILYIDTYIYLYIYAWKPCSLPICWITYYMLILHFYVLLFLYFLYYAWLVLFPNCPTHAKGCFSPRRFVRNSDVSGANKWSWREPKRANHIVGQPAPIISKTCLMFSLSSERRASDCWPCRARTRSPAGTLSACRAPCSPPSSIRCTCTRSCWAACCIRPTCTGKWAIKYWRLRYTGRRRIRRDQHQ